ncbi:RagB/SusD family nutrient uptake outer membrane protein [Bacteroides gallinaceum]|uniref:RagB/SusD family nutrient uptake outer membrane protein n=1 Tax=Bacteroides gallinaceum TaxID=1462571 RepID=UPI0025A3DDA9|nr:RagB/SusD family nutrient uptake outer membrane protein [Bacteroides gallinaceum]MDM8208379.1 RagB/SusD family nutrient uptake outer membrane protein [Bacteroides gallinaceum]
MKNLYKLMLALALTGQLTSCDYLDIVPDERAQESDTWKTPNSIKGYLYSCYGYMPLPRQYPGSYWLPEEMTSVTKELFTTFKYGTYSPSSLSYTTQTWATVWNGIRQCYKFKEALDNAFSTNISEETKTVYKAEADFLIAYYHFLSLRSYGPTMIIRGVIDQNTPIADFPERSSYDEVVQFINDKLDEAIPHLPDTWSGDDYGRATRLLALAVKSRMYLYAASPLFNGNSEMYSSFVSPIDGRHLISQEYSVEKWQKAADASKYAIDELEKTGFHLYDDAAAGTPSDDKPGLPNPAQRRLRYTILDFNNNPEVIWCDTRGDEYYGIQRRTIPRQNSGSFKAGISCVICPTLQSVERFYTKNGLPMDMDKTYNYEGRYDYVDAPINNDGNNYDGGVSAGKVMRLTTDREPRFYAWVGYHNGYYEFGRYEDKDPGNGDPAKRAIKSQFLKNDPHGRGNRTDAEYSISGFANKKWSYPKFSGTMIECPMVQFRLGEIYLNYAEALVELNRLDEAKVYIDKIRERAGIPSVDEAWNNYSTNPGYQDTQDGLRQIVRQERINELYFEGHLFFDYRRWKVAEQFVGMPDRGLNTLAETIEDFTPMDLPLQRSFHKGQYLMPIPQDEINKAPQIVQNPYY